MPPGYCIHHLAGPPCCPHSGTRQANEDKHEMSTFANSLCIRTVNIAKDARTPELIAGLIKIWEASVRASHHFLTEDDIHSLCPQAEDAVRQIETLWAVYDDDAVIGFMGIQSCKIEMLFLHPGYFRKGIGRKLIKKAFSELDVQYVDVNEQNPSALRFYERMGFRTFRRDSTDDCGNPFPVLRMKRL